MRLARKLTLLAIAAIAAMGLAATSASAQVTVTEEPGGASCAAGCHIAAEGSSSLTAHQFGVEQVVSVCTDDTFEGTVDSSGGGTVTQITLAGTNCNSVPCTTGGAEDPWPFQIVETAGVETLEIEFCLFNAEGMKTYCEPPVSVTTTGHTHVLSIVDFTCPSGVELSGSWEIASGSGETVEIAH